MMRICWIGLLACVVVASGCRQDARISSHIELMNAERRALENQLYELEYEYESAVAEIQRLKEMNEDLRDEAGGESRARRGRSTRPSRPSTPDLSPPVVEEGELRIPQIELPDEADQGGAELRPPAQVPVSARGPRLSPLDPEVRRLVLHPRLTRGVNLDQEPGDDGLEIVLQPVNQEGEIVALAGPVSVVVLDYALRGQGDAARIARWELSAEEVGRFLKDSPKEGIRLQLLWPDKPPQHDRLRVDVRYEALDGRQFDARRDVRIDLASRLSRRWTPRAGGASRTSGSDAPAARQAAAERPPAPDQRPQWSPHR